MTAKTERVQVQAATMGLESIVVDIRHDTTETLFGSAIHWWAELTGVRCCPDAPLDMLHIDRVDAIEHARALVRKRQWPPT